MKITMRILQTTTILLTLLSLDASASLRDKIKDRILKKLEDKPAPVASTDVTSRIEKPGTYTFKITIDNMDRYYMVHVPKNYKPQSPSSLLFAIHGGGGNMKIQAKNEYYKQISKSEETGSITVFPNGYSKFQSGSFATWNAGHCCGDARDKNVDEIAFFKAMVKNLSSQLNIDSKRIYATGMSNGGMMAYRLACEMTDTFAAIASVTGTDNTKNCTPSKPISILHIHAKDDEHVNFNGGAGKKAAPADKITNFTSVPATIAKWVEFNQCEKTPKQAGKYCEVYEKCRDGVKVQLCVTPTGGHSWPGGIKPRGGDETFKDLSANDVMWDFFKKVGP